MYTEVFFVSLIFLDIFLLLISSLFDLRITSYYYLGIFDLFASILFLLGYYYKLKDKIANFQIVNIVAFIPIYFIFINVLGFTSPNYLIIIRLIVLIKVLILLRFFKFLGSRVIEFQEKSKLIYPIAFFSVVLFACSAIFLFVEKGINPNVVNYEDSLWYVLQTITTVGYGDIVPYTAIGRLTGVIAMISAIIVTSLVTASATSSLVEAFRQEREKLTEKSMERIMVIESKIDVITNTLEKLDKIDELNSQLKEIKSEVDKLKKPK
ncbi:MAG: ion channel [Methanomicrobiales archaeon]